MRPTWKAFLKHPGAMWATYRMTKPPMICKISRRQKSVLPTGRKNEKLPGNLRLTRGIWCREIPSNRWIKKLLWSTNICRCSSRARSIQGGIRKDIPQGTQPEATNQPVAWPAAMMRDVNSTKRLAHSLQRLGLAPSCCRRSPRVWPGRSKSMLRAGHRGFKYLRAAQLL